MCGRGFGWGNGRGLVGCDWISHHAAIAFSFPEILHATPVSTNTVFIQSLMHLRVRHFHLVWLYTMIMPRVREGSLVHLPTNPLTWQMINLAPVPDPLCRYVCYCFSNTFLYYIRLRPWGLASPTGMPVKYSSYWTITFCGSFIWPNHWYWCLVFIGGYSTASGNVSWSESSSIAATCCSTRCGAQYFLLAKRKRECATIV